MSNKEIFKDVPNYNGIYKVSNLGNVKSLKFGKEKILKQSKRTNYMYVVLYKNNKTKTFDTHQLIAMAFLEHVPNRKEFIVDHINNNKLDNRLENLQIISQRQNSTKDLKIGTSKFVGVYFNKKENKYMSRIYINGKRKYLGLFVSEHEASKAYQKELLTLNLI